MTRIDRLKSLIRHGLAVQRREIVRYRAKIDSLMGWTEPRGALQQAELRFSSPDEAMAFARRHGLRCVVETPRTPKSYADTFRCD